MCSESCSKLYIEVGSSTEKAIPKARCAREELLYYVSSKPFHFPFVEKVLVIFERIIVVNRLFIRDIVNKWTTDDSVVFLNFPFRSKQFEIHSASEFDS